MAKPAETNLNYDEQYSRSKKETRLKAALLMAALPILLGTGLAISKVQEAWSKADGSADPNGAQVETVFFATNIADKRIAFFVHPWNYKNYGAWAGFMMSKLQTREEREKHTATTWFSVGWRTDWDGYSSGPYVDLQRSDGSYTGWPDTSDPNPESPVHYRK